MWLLREDTWHENDEIKIPMNASKVINRKIVLKKIMYFLVKKNETYLKILKNKLKIV